MRKHQLPLCYHPAPEPPGTVKLGRASHVSLHCRCYAPLPSICLLGYAFCRVSPSISTPRDSKAGGVLTNNLHRTWPDSQSRLITTYPIASSCDAFTGLSYPAIFPACAKKYQRLQVSPPRPDTSRCPQQPTCGAWVIRSPASPKADL